MIDEIREGGISTSVDGEVSRTATSGGQTQHSGIAPDVKGNTITHARTPSGFPRTGASITENDIISVKGSEGRIKDMIAAGLVQKGEDGVFSLSESSPTQKDETATPESTGESLEAVSSDIEASITEVSQRAAPGDVLGVITGLINHGEVNDAALGRVASQLGIEPEAARDRTETIRAAFEGQARAVVEANGLDANDVFAWAHQNSPDTLKRAMINQATRRSTSGYNEVVSEYITNLDKANPDAILNAQFGEGITASRMKNGKIVIQTPQGSFEWGALVRTGQVKVSRARR